MLVGNAPIASIKLKLNPRNIMKMHAPIQRLLNVFIVYGAPDIPRSRTIIRIPMKITNTGKNPPASTFHTVGNPIYRFKNSNNPPSRNALIYVSRRPKLKNTPRSMNITIVFAHPNGFHPKLILINRLIFVAFPVGNR